MTRNANATSLKDEKFVVLVTIPFTGRAIRHPSAPPIRARLVDSTRNESITASGLKPRISSTATSRVRALTAANMVFIAPNTAPTAMISTMNQPATRIVLESITLWSA